MPGFFARIKDYFDNRRVMLRRFIGLAVSAFTLLALVSCISYLFTWKQDQSLLLDPGMMDSTASVAANFGGKLGLRLSAFLVNDLFGLGAFAVVVALVILSVRLVFGERKFSVIKSLVLAIVAAVLMSFVLAYFSLRTGLENMLGGSLGGECGLQGIKWMETMVGSIVTFFILVIFCIVWTFFVSRRFSAWFVNVGEGIVATDEESGEEQDKKTFNFFRKDETRTEDGQEAGPVAEPENPIEEEPESEEPVLPEPQPVAPVVEPKPSPEPQPKTDNFTIQHGDDISTDVTRDLPRIDVREELENYKFPSLDLLNDYSDMVHSVSSEELKRNNFKIRATLETYKIGVEKVTAVVGPTITLYKVFPASGVKISAIEGLNKEIAMALNATKIRMVQLRDSIGIEVPNDTASVVPLKAMLNDDEFRNSKAELPVAIGYATLTQKVKVFDLAEAPHLLVAGATKQGKSVGLNVLITSLLYSKHPSELKLVFVDPKMVEFSAYAKLLHHYLAVLPTAASESEEMSNAIVKKAADADAILRSLCIEMDARYELMSKAEVSKITLYNDKYRDRHLLPTEGHHFLPYIVTVIDEYADLVMSSGAGGEDRKLANSISKSIIRLAQKGRAAGIHIVLATQRPSVDIITGIIKANFPTRIAFRVFSRTDSQTILDKTGAETLIGRGDMIYYAGAELVRVQCALIESGEISAITKEIASQTGYKKSYNVPYYLPDPDEGKTEDGTGALDMNDLDERFEEAARMVVANQRGSTSDLQRRLGMGYAKAGRVMDQLEAAGIVGPQEGSKPRQVLIASLEELDLRLKELKANS